MRLRAYLIRRSIHTVITLVVFLVILFAIFRLMPGDPTRLFTRPGESQEARDEICVSFGLCKRIPAAGNAFESGFETGVPGPYAIRAYMNDSGGHQAIAYFSHTRVKPFDLSDRVRITNVTFDRDNWAYLPNDVVTVRTSVVAEDLDNANVTAEFQNETGAQLPPGVVTMSRELLTSTFNTTFTPQISGFYAVKVTVNDSSVPGSANTTYGFTVNDWAQGAPGVMGPFHFVEGAFTSSQSTDLRATLSVSVVSSGGSISDIQLAIRSPPPFSAVEYRTALHPDAIVRKSILEQFASYFVNMVTFNFGRSFRYGTPVIDEISVRVGPTLLLFGTAIMLDYALGILIGSIIAWRRGSKLELGTIVTTLFFYAMPVFWLGLVLLWIFAANLKVLPLGGMGGFDQVGNRLQGLDYVKDVLWHLALPLVTLILIGLAGSILLMRSNMLEVMGEDYVTTARAKGLTERAILYKHAARNALLPVVTSIAISIGFIISGGVLTETVFSWPGMGKYLVDSTLAQDFPSVQGAFFILAIMTIISNMMADILYAYLDPRVRL